MQIPRMSCTDCGSYEVIAVWPGDDGEVIADLFRLTPARERKCWCEACWWKRFGKSATPATLESSGKRQPHHQ